MMYAPSSSALVVGVRLAIRSAVIGPWPRVKRDHHNVCPVGGTLIHNGYEMKYNTGINFKQKFRVFHCFYVSVNLRLDKLLLELLL